MNEQKRNKELLRTSHERLNRYVDDLLRDPEIKEAVQQEQNPARKELPRKGARKQRLKRA